MKQVSKDNIKKWGVGQMLGRGSKNALGITYTNERRVQRHGKSFMFAKHGNEFLPTNNKINHN